MLAFARTTKTVIERVLGAAVALVVAVLVVDVLWGVVTRFVLGDPSTWTEEVATLLLMWVTFLGAVVGFSRHEHLGLDYFTKKLHPDAEKAMKVLAQLVVLAFAAIVLVKGGEVLVRRTLAEGQLTPALQIKMGYVYLVTPLAGVAIVLVSVLNIVETLYEKPTEATPG